MNTQHLLRTLAASLGLLAGALALRADVVELSDGSRLIGKVTKIDGGTVFLTTTYAGDLKIDQKLVTALSTE